MTRRALRRQALAAALACGLLGCDRRSTAPAVAGGSASSPEVALVRVLPDPAPGGMLYRGWPLIAELAAPLPKGVADCAPFFAVRPAAASGSGEWRRLAALPLAPGGGQALGGLAIDAADTAGLAVGAIQVRLEWQRGGVVAARSRDWQLQIAEAPAAGADSGGAAVKAMGATGAMGAIAARRRALVALRAGRASAALAESERGLALEPESVAGLTLAGQAAEALGDSDAAVRFYRRGLEVLARRRLSNTLPEPLPERRYLEARLRSIGAAPVEEASPLR